MHFHNSEGQIKIIAEAGINHNGDLIKALDMIDAAAEAKADVCKFQLLKAAEMYAPDAGRYTTKGGTFNIYDVVRQSELGDEWIPALIEHSQKRGIEFLVTVYDHTGLEEILHYKPSILKVASYEISFLSLFEEISKKQIPLIFSTAGATLGDIELAISAYGSPERLCIMHCNGSYPAQRNIVNMNVLNTLKLAFPECAIGFSDHTEDPEEAPSAAAALGASVIEKHFTLDKRMKGPDHIFAVNPEGLKRLVKSVRATELAVSSNQEITIDPILLGSTQKYTQPQEQYVRRFAYRTLYSKTTIQQGDRFSLANIAVLRSGEKQPGMHPSLLNALIGRRAAKTIEANTELTLETILG